MKARMSTPATVKEGAVPLGQSTEAGQVIAADPPFVNLNMNPLALDEDWPEKVKLVMAPATVAVT